MALREPRVACGCVGKATARQPSQPYTHAGTRKQPRSWPQRVSLRLRQERTAAAKAISEHASGATVVRQAVGLWLQR